MPDQVACFAIAKGELADVVGVLILFVHTESDVRSLAGARSARRCRTASQSDGWLPLLAEGGAVEHPGAETPAQL